MLQGLVLFSLRGTESLLVRPGGRTTPAFLTYVWGLRERPACTWKAVLLGLSKVVSVFLLSCPFARPAKAEVCEW